MARRLNPWFLGILGGCVLLALVYVPPRGQPGWLRGISGGVRIVSPNESRVRSKELGAMWREVSVELQWLKVRNAVREAMSQRRQRAQFGPVVVVEGSDSLGMPASEILQQAVDSVWSSLGLRETKIGAALLARYRSEAAGTPRLVRTTEAADGTVYILPDTLDRSTCLISSRVPFWLLRGKRFVSQRDLVVWAKAVIGPCAFYARFGMPSLRVERWLSARHFDVARLPNWFEDAKTEGWVFEDFEDQNGTLAATHLRERILRSWLYAYPRATASCFVGRPEVCRRTIAAADQPGEGPLPRFVLPFSDFDPTRVQLVHGNQFLAQVLRRGGGDRFLDFWTTSLPIDSALTLAVGEPIGKFVTEYHAQLSPLRPTVGAAPRERDAALTLLVTGLFLGIVMLLQGRRDVR